MFSRVNVSTWTVRGGEPDGLSEHPWLLAPDDDRLWLFKPVEIKGDHRQGEDWAEKVVSEVAHALHIPSARIELAVADGREGCISRDVRPSRWDLQPGATLLSGVVEGYESRIKGRAGHSIENILRALHGIGVPPEVRDDGLEGAFDVFAAYLTLDALVANQDRHDHNWAVMIPPPGEQDMIRLSSSYDHASSLGFNLTDFERAGRLKEPTLQGWASKGAASRFEHPLNPARPDTLVGLARRALDLAPPRVARLWLDRLQAIPSGLFEDLMSACPGLSDVTRRFAAEVLKINRQRLLEALDPGGGRSTC